MLKWEVSLMVSIVILTLTLIFQSLSFLTISSRILALGTIPMETVLTYFLKEHFSYFPCNGFMRDALCEFSSLLRQQMSCFCYSLLHPSFFLFL